MTVNYYNLYASASWYLSQMSECIEMVVMATDEKSTAVHPAARLDVVKDTVAAKGAEEAEQKHRANYPAFCVFRSDLHPKSQ